MASLESQRSLHTVPHRPPKHISTLPSSGVAPPTSRMEPSGVHSGTRTGERGGVRGVGGGERGGERREGDEEGGGGARDKSGEERGRSI